MKKYSILVALLVLTTALLTGCRRPGATPTELPPTQGATLMPTTEATTMPTTAHTTMPATEMPTGSAGVGTDPTETENASNTGATNETTNSRSRMTGGK